MRLVSERFEQVRVRVAELFGRSEDFRDLCEDYEACAVTLTRLEAETSSSSDLRNEYAALLLRLERELLRFLEEHRDVGGTPPEPVK